MEQPQYNLFERDKVERDYAPIYDSYGLGTTIWSPLASGLLTGKYNDGIPQGSRAALPGYEWLRDIIAGPKGRRRVEQVKALARIAVGAGMPIHHLALLWCLANPRVSTVILGASKLDQLHDNLKALDGKAALTPDVLAAIEEVVQNKPEAPQRFTLYFLEGRDELTAESKKDMEKVLAEVRRRPAPDVIVVGHTDRVGSLQDNDRLALRRAERLRSDLLKQGLPADSVQAAGRGEREPLVATADEVAEPRNRRVEMLVR